MIAALHAVPASAPALPAYVPSGNECALFEHAWRHRLPVLLKGPTGCGKTRFVAHMAAKLGRSTPSPATTISPPPISPAAICSGEETRCGLTVH